MKNYKIAIQGMILATALGATTANAGIYVGLSYGQANVDDNTVAGPVKESGTGWKFSGGHDQLFSEIFGFDTGWVDLGDQNERSATKAIDMETEGFYFMGTASHYFNKDVSVFAKGGVIFWDQDLRDTLTTRNDSNDGTDLAFGIGMQYGINSVLQLRAEWERYNTAIPVSMFNVGIALKF
ncbi:MAG: outer membrane beta-barrel protein [Gammaproteobacteria bacterium]|nr:outer membrane beta-barrel protein [Gammaproteobacteria bacterium]